MINSFDFFKEAFRESPAGLKPGEIFGVAKQMRVQFGIQQWFDDILQKDISLEQFIGSGENSFQNLCEGLIKSDNTISHANDLQKTLRDASDVSIFVRGLTKDVTNEEFILAFVARARKVAMRLKNILSKQTGDEEMQKEIALFADYKEILPSDKLNVAIFFQRQKLLNWFVLVGLLDKAPYNLLYKLNAYNFMTKTERNLCTQHLAGYSNATPDSQGGIFAGKSVLCLGDGNGVDGKFILDCGAKEVTLIDGGNVAMQYQKNLRDSLPDPQTQARFHIESQTWDMMSYLQDMKNRDEKVDTVFGHSVTHYYDDATFKKLCGLVLDVLNEGGHFAFAVKLPGAFHDGNGIPLLIKESVLKPVDGVGTRRSTGEHIFRDSMWFNDDGQTRYFRTQETLKQRISEVRTNGCWFEFQSGNELCVQNYDLSLGGQLFYIVVLRKVSGQK